MPSSLDALLVSNPHLIQDGELFWPQRRSRLALLFETLVDKIIVRGFDPDVDLADKSVFVFRAEVLLAQRDPFVQAVREGREPTLMPVVPPSNENQVGGAVKQLIQPLVDGNSIVISGNPGDGPGPKMYQLSIPASGTALAG